MVVVISVEELFDRGLWLRYCELTDANEWAVNEGLLDMDDVVELSYYEAKELGLVN